VNAAVTREITDWLGDLGMSEYAERFAENGINLAALRHLTDQDLKDIGVLLGHRRIMLAAIAELSGAPAATSKPPAGLEPKLVDAAERRQVTVMFSDLVGSTALSARMDPEDMREVIFAYQKCVAEVIRGFDGFVAKYMGDGVLAYFGYPQAHEDDAERAVRAGLAVVEGVGKLRSAEPPQVRIGVATGLVVVGDLIGSGAAQEQAIVGDTPNLAARLQGIAEPNTVVIAESTRKLLGKLFDLEDLGARDLKGIADPSRAFVVLRPSSVESRFEALHGSALTRLIGRDEEIDLLLRRWGRAKAGQGQVALVSGEAGLGKSRITAALVERLHAEPHLLVRYFCSPYNQGSALFPFIDQLGRGAGFSRDDTPTAKLKKLDALLARAAVTSEAVAFIADLLSLPNSQHTPLPSLTPQRKKQKTLEALIRWLEGLARQQPLVMVFEDAHWIDPTSRELLDLVVEHVRSLPVLLVVTFRPEFQVPWTGQAQVCVLTLNRLDPRDCTALVAEIAGGRALPDEVVDQIVHRTDGVPLFVEELTKSVLESDLLRKEADCYVLDGALLPLAIPTTLHDSLMARLDRLSGARHVAQIGAAIGREFTYALLHAVCRLPEDELQTGLARLVASELMFQRGVPPDAVYTFKHALVQDAAHVSLLRSARKQLHAQIAKAIETHFPETVDSQPELLAQHYADSGLAEKSVAYWARAGQRSAAHSAMAEAAAQFQKGLDQLMLLPDDDGRRRQELELRSALGAVLQAVKGLAAPETGIAYARARELWEQLGSPSEFFHVPAGQSIYHMFRGEFDLALRLDEDLLNLSRQRGDSSGLVLGCDSAGRNLMLTGRFASSRSNLEEGLALYDPTSHHSLVHQIGTHPHVTSQAYLGLVLFCLGFPDRALAHSRAAIEKARSLRHPPSFAVSLSMGSRVVSLRGDTPTIDDWSDQLVAVTTEQGFPYYRALGTIYRGWVEVANGNVAGGISLLRRGSSASRATRAEVWMSYHTALLARACEIAGQIDECLSLLDDAFQIVARNGTRWLEAELYRHKGQLLLRQQGHSETAEELFREALSIAERQGAKLWELRGAVSLARLWRDQGKPQQARELLAPVYGWFTEGFDTLDLKEAKALLDELAA
jgi:class 3 adenylate cyclase/predicted ATPase